MKRLSLYLQRPILGAHKNDANEAEMIMRKRARMSLSMTAHVTAAQIEHFIPPSGNT